MNLDYVLNCNNSFIAQSIFQSDVVPENPFSTIFAFLKGHTSAMTNQSYYNDVSLVGIKIFTNQKEHLKLVVKKLHTALKEKFIQTEIN